MQRIFQNWSTLARARTRALACTVGWSLLLSCCLAALSVARAADAPRALPATAVVRFDGTSTLHDFGGQLPALPFALQLSNGTWSATGAVWAGQMATGSDKRDRNMHEMLRTNTFPKVEGVVSAAPVPGPAGTNVTLKLKVRDRSLDLPVRITSWTESPETIKFHAIWELSLKEYGLKPPSVVGVIRVGDRVKLQADVTASKTTSPLTPPTPPP